MNKKNNKELEKKLEEAVEKTAKNAEKFVEKTLGKIIGFIVTIVVNVIILAVINYHYDRFSFLTTEFPEWLPYANASIFASIIAQVLLFVIPSKTTKPLFELFSNIFSLISIIFLRLIYPFDWSMLIDKSWVDILAKVSMTGVIIAVFIATVVNGVKFAIEAFGLKIKCKEEE
ncbi:MAG: hypothetical protein PHS44_04340 [Candidatus Dojkabacteria bacterium]|nr:hypothetical protein [Candidatus Dojkabacteria bacterium]